MDMAYQSVAALGRRGCTGCGWIVAAFFLASRQAAGGVRQHPVARQSNAKFDEG